MLEKTCTQIVRAVPLSLGTTAGLHEKRIIPVDRNDFRYLRFRAIGNLEVSGPNGNADAFPYEHFEDTREGYGSRSFIGKRAHVEHNSAEGLAGSIGDLPDAFLNKFIYPQDISPVKKWADLLSPEHTKTRAKLLEHPLQKDGSIEVLMRIDTQLVKNASTNKKTKQLLERIVRMIDTGQKLACSMGTNVMYSDCSVCGNRVKFANEYCGHLLPGKKGALFVVPSNQIRDLLDSGRLRAEWLPHITTSAKDVKDILEGISNRGLAVRASEINHELSFFELSVVAVPAYEKADQLEKLARKQDEDRKEYLTRIAREFGEDTIVDLYEILQQEGKISNSCMVH